MKEKVLIGIALLTLLLLSGCSNINNLNEYCKKEEIDVCTFENVRCYKMCKEIINATSYYFDYSGFGSHECWCYKDGEPIKVY